MKGSAEFYKFCKKALSREINKHNFPRTKVSGSQMAHLAGISASEVSRWRAGTYKFQNLQKLLNVCNTLRIPVELGASILIGDVTADEALSEKI